MGGVTRWTAVALGLIAAVALAGCASDSPSGDQSKSTTNSLSGRNKGAKEAADAIAAGNLKLKEYPPLPYPPGHQEYVALLRTRCGVEYEVPQLPPGVAEADFIQEVQGWNEVMQAEIRRKYGPGIFEQLQEEARKRWSEQLSPKDTR